MKPHLLHEAAKELARLQELEVNMCHIRATERAELAKLLKENAHLRRMLHGTNPVESGKFNQGS